MLSSVFSADVSVMPLFSGILFSNFEHRIKIRMPNIPTKQKSNTYFWGTCCLALTAIAPGKPTAAIKPPITLPIINGK